MRSAVFVLSGLVMMSLYGCDRRSGAAWLSSDAEQAALDVNDVSILFPKTGDGAFYPNIDIRTVWPEKPFNDLIAFAKDGQLNGVKFGQFILPADYASLVRDFLSHPEGSAGNDPKRRASKEIAEEIRQNHVQCTTNADASQLCIDASARPSFEKHRIAVADKTNWRIVSMRMDLCAGAHSGEVDACEVEFRLIAQPFGDFAPVPPVNGVTPPLNTVAGQRGPHMFDVSAHLLYKIGKLNLETGNIVDGSGRIVTTARNIIADLQAVKARSPVSTNGRPLGVHPGLRQEAQTSGSAMGRALTDLIQKYTQFGAALTNVTSMHLAGQTVFDASTWAFFQGVIENGSWAPTPITGSNTLWSIRTRSVKGATGKMFPPPELQNRRNTINSIFAYEDGQTLPPAVADLPLFFDNPGRFGDPSLIVNGKVAASVKNSDCISCHMTATRAYEWGIKSVDSTGKPRPSLYVPPVGVTGYLDPEVIPRIDYNLRNLGYFLPPPLVTPLTGNEVGLGIFNFVGPRVERPTIMTRVAFESAELVNLINSRFLGVPNPGLTCQGEDPAAALSQSQGDDVYSDSAQRVIRRNALVHAAVADCLLFEAYKPGVSFETCTRVCRGPAVPTPTPTPTPTARPGSVDFAGGTFAPQGGGSAALYTIDQIGTDRSESGATYVSSLRLSKDDNDGPRRITFICDAGGSCGDTEGRLLQIISKSVIIYTSAGRSVQMTKKEA